MNQTTMHAKKSAASVTAHYEKLPRRAEVDPYPLDSPPREVNDGLHGLGRVRERPMLEVNGNLEAVS